MQPRDCFLQQTAGNLSAVTSSGVQCLATLLYLARRPIFIGTVRPQYELNASMSIKSLKNTLLIGDVDIFRKPGYSAPR
jgi:hypothetical protein